MNKAVVGAAVLVLALLLIISSSLPNPRAPATTSPPAGAVTQPPATAPPAGTTAPPTSSPSTTTAPTTTTPPSTTTPPTTTPPTTTTPTTTSAASGNLEVHFIDVGQGDAIYLRTPTGMDVLIDGGVQAAGSAVVSYLRGLGVDDLELVINNIWPP